ncbi:hypothetical protein ACWCPT_28455 [Streptomyces sp. NPDC002308]
MSVVNTSENPGGGPECAPVGTRASAADRPNGAPGCLLAGFGALVAPLLWAPRAAVNVEGGLEGHARDLSVLWIDLPLVVLGGAAVPLLAWALTRRWTYRRRTYRRRTYRPWVPALVPVLVALAAFALGSWGLLEWWTPRGDIWGDS